MAISGNWVNVYNSTMQLVQTDTGYVYGSYSSTTGSSGAYYIVGFGSPTPNANGGQPLALSILWRSYEGGQGDPSWHYVSGFSGQSITVDQVPNLILLHDLVATAPFPSVVPGLGDYLDKLVFTPREGSTPPWPLPVPVRPEGLASPVDGAWACVQDPTMTLTLELQDATWGFVSGSAVRQGNQTPVAGFTDCYAVADSLTLQGLSLSAFFPALGQEVAWAGSLDLSSDVLSLALMNSVGTTPGSLWTQTRFQGLDFVRAGRPSTRS